MAPAFAADPPARADLRADVNRDGAVDVAGDTDTAGEDRWTTRRGAVFLPNIDDDTKRCKSTGPNGKPLPDAQLAKCNDAADTKVNGAADAADLARLRTVPMPDLRGGATGTVKVTGTGAKHTRLFVKRATGWTAVTPTTRLSAAELRAGVELGIEGTDVVRDRAVWDGTAVVELKVSPGGGAEASTDRVTLHAAPLLTHHHLQQAQQVLVTELRGNDPYERTQRKFVKTLETEVKRAGIATPLVKFTKGDDIWAQDFLEPGYVTMAGPGGTPQGMRVMIRSAQPDRTAGRQVFEKLRGRDVGGVQVALGRGDESSTLDSMGNLETIPAYEHGGRSYPAGRIIMGEQKDIGFKPAKAMRTLLASQGMQDPLLLDTSWLHVGHVDEFVQFLPADTPRGWRIAVADPEAGMRLLKDAKAAGHGATKMFSVKGTGDTPAPKETIDQALASRELRADNALAARRIAANLEILKRETGVTDAEVVRVPALFTRGSGERGDVAGTPRLTRLGASVEVPDAVREYGQQRDLKAPAADTVMTSAYIPGAVNGVVLGKDRYLAPRQWGPVIGGKDIFTEAVDAVYRAAGMRVSYIDDYATYHLGMGEVHCGTNTLRDISTPWWKR
ncbi:protein-arginine deiminase domain-containing protein [Streptomyces sp. XD-27]|uniref:protein-arginine deiminase domain-containing protein n=1 Tax=Streptomyces sp. XD-27 TaxID=3062779 RepID=UPI0026F41033|nr:protein-arginine deiminase domain-containing protein [Streptomyces sp. XD-27]WKX73301.1 protein-arginine deiminase domain-containing protein [Streptomyces sp. XD-27]